MTGFPTKGIAALAAAVFLAGCEDMMSGSEETTMNSTGSADMVRMVERDVEAPEVFSATDSGLWDGRPSLGGVWVAHPDVKDPERVIIRNQDNGKFVIGALFRRERENPGPRIQVSSDAAEALGLLAGQPRSLNITALRREEVPEGVPAEASAEEIAGEIAVEGPAEVEEMALDPIASAAAAIDAAETAETALPEITAPAAEVPAPTPVAAPAARPPSALAKPFIQIGIFSIEQNARNTATSMRQIGIIPTVLEQESAGKRFWRVIVGPATSSAERATLLRKIKDQGFTDAYAVTN